MNDTKKIQKELTDVVVPSCLLTKDPEKMTNAPMQYLISRKREEDRFF